MVMREYFIELIKNARTASPTEKLQIEADLALIVKELLKPFWGRASKPCSAIVVTMYT
jgi:hypothetical protein